MKYRVISETPVTVTVLQGSKLESLRFSPGETLFAAPKHAQKLLGSGLLELVNTEPLKETKKTSTRVVTQAKSKEEVSE
ncbi:MAG: hypothetical protein AAF329_01040 [Cyanobacteria bacterium P01_A01_bin.17]